VTSTVAPCHPTIPVNAHSISRLFTCLALLVQRGRARRDWSDLGNARKRVSNKADAGPLLASVFLDLALHGRAGRVFALHPVGHIEAHGPTMFAHACKMGLEPRRGFVAHKNNPRPVAREGGPGSFAERC
jgi:hypothetical protein